MLKTFKVLCGLILIGAFAVSLTTLIPIPPGPIGPYINGTFPKTTPGAGGSWLVTDALSDVDIASPLRILEFPGSTDLLVLSKLGLVWRVSITDQSKQLVLDITDRSFKRGEAGTVGMVLHPEFGPGGDLSKQQLFIFYRHKPNPDEWNEKGFNRLSKFSWNQQQQRFDEETEEILIQQYDRSTWHNGGGMFFDPVGLLYLSLGDEGHEYQSASTQSLTGGLFSGILRIDVDNDPTRSHPIRRQPGQNGSSPSGWGTSFSQGYSIPNDNPWQSASGEILEEFYALGIRSPYSLHFEKSKNQIWVSDVGAGTKEEISRIEKGDNLQWPYMEGTTISENHQKPIDFVGNEKIPFFEYDRSVGSCIIGGGVYMGTTFSSLNEKFLFADYTQNKLMALSGTGTTNPEIEILIGNLGGQGIVLPESPGISGIHILSDGQVLLTIIGEDFTAPGKILRLQQKVIVPDPPLLLSELGVFTDMENLIPVQGIIPYTVNAPLWSDHALKKRWMAIPNDGDFNEAAEQIDFNNLSDWTFPEGTVFIKHFDLPISEEVDGPIVPLETRFFVIGENGVGYGLTYKWNDDGTDATLLGGGSSKIYELYEGGEIVGTQTWDFPGRDQCMSCHNPNANYIIGVKTHQLNGEVYYPALGSSKNQLEHLNDLGVFSQKINSANSYLKAFPLDDETVDLELRIRSYLDANCASCHQQGGVPMINHDMRFTHPERFQNIIDVPTLSQASAPDRKVVEAGNHLASELWIRDASLEEKRMPPVGRNLIDQMYIDSLGKWIDNLEPSLTDPEEINLFPNPSNGWLVLRLGDQWKSPFDIEVYNTSGQLLYQEISEWRSIYLELASLSAGTYFIVVKTENLQQVRKFILQ